MEWTHLVVLRDKNNKIIEHTIARASVSTIPSEQYSSNPRKIDSIVYKEALNVTSSEMIDIIPLIMPIIEPDPTTEINNGTPASS